MSRETERSVQFLTILERQNQQILLVEHEKRKRKSKITPKHWGLSSSVIYGAVEKKLNGLGYRSVARVGFVELKCSHEHLIDLWISFSQTFSNFGLPCLNLNLHLLRKEMIDKL